MVGVWGTWGRGEPLLWAEKMVRSEVLMVWEARWAVRFNAGLPEAVCTAVVEWILAVRLSSGSPSMRPKPANTIPCFSERSTSPKKLFGSPFQTLASDGSVASSDECPTGLNHRFAISSKCLFGRSPRREYPTQTRTAMHFRSRAKVLFHFPNPCKSQS